MLAVFVELFGDLRNDHARLGERIPVDHRHAIRLEIHPLGHVKMAQGVAG